MRPRRKLRHRGTWISQSSSATFSLCASVVKKFPRRIRLEEPSVHLQRKIYQELYRHSGIKERFSMFPLTSVVKSSRRRYFFYENKSDTFIPAFLPTETPDRIKYFTETRLFFERLPVKLLRQFPRHCKRIPAKA